MWAISLTFSPPVWHLWLAQENRVGGRMGTGERRWGRKQQAMGWWVGMGNNRQGQGWDRTHPARLFCKRLRIIFFFCMQWLGWEETTQIKTLIAPPGWDKCEQTLPTLLPLHAHTPHTHTHNAHEVLALEQGSQLPTGYTVANRGSYRKRWEREEGREGGGGRHPRRQQQQQQHPLLTPQQHPSG